MSESVSVCVRESAVAGGRRKKRDEAGAEAEGEGRKKKKEKERGQRHSRFPPGHPRQY